MKLEVCQKWGELDKKGFTDLTESSKSPASIAQSSKQWVGTCLYQEWLAPLLISCEAAFGYEQVAKRIANVRFTEAETEGFEPSCRLPDNLISSQARYGHFDTSPYLVRQRKRLFAVVPIYYKTAAGFRQPKIHF